MHSFDLSAFYKCYTINAAVFSVLHVRRACMTLTWYFGRRYSLYRRSQKCQKFRKCAR